MPRAGLTRPALVQTGAELADATGWDLLTLSAIADAVGVRQPSLYKHVTGLPGMRREIQLLALHELGTALAGAAAGRAGLDALRAVSTAYRQYARSHPGRYAATLTAPMADDAPLQDAAGRVLSTIEAVLTGYGVEASDAVHAVRALRALLHGFVAIESSGGFALAEDVDESFDRLIDGFDRSLVGIH